MDLVLNQLVCKYVQYNPAIVDCKIVETCKIVDNTWMIKMIFSTKWTVKIVENPIIVEKFLVLKQSTIARFYCSNVLLTTKWHDI